MAYKKMYIIHNNHGMSTTQSIYKNNDYIVYLVQEKCTDRIWAVETFVNYIESKSEEEVEEVSLITVFSRGDFNQNILDSWNCRALSNN